MPVEVLGLEDLPEAGDNFQVVTDTAKAKQIVLYRAEKERAAATGQDRPHHARTAPQQDGGGRSPRAAASSSRPMSAVPPKFCATRWKSFPPIRSPCACCAPAWAPSTNPTCCSPRRRTPSCSASTCGPERNAAAAAEQEKVDIRLHTIIYEVVDEMKKAMAGSAGAGLQGSLQGQGRSPRDVQGFEDRHGRGQPGARWQLHARFAMFACCATASWSIPAKSASLRRFKDDVSEVRSGMECGITLENFNDVHQGDIIEGYRAARGVSRRSQRKPASAHGRRRRPHAGAAHRTRALPQGEAPRGQEPEGPAARQVQRLGRGDRRSGSA